VRGHKKAADVRQLRRKVFGDAVGQIFLSDWSR